jgi:hypothetical protein
MEEIREIKLITFQNSLGTHYFGPAPLEFAQSADISHRGLLASSSVIENCCFTHRTEIDHAGCLFPYFFVEIYCPVPNILTIFQY